MCSPTRTKGAPTRDPRHMLMLCIGIELLEPHLTPVHPCTTTATFNGCTRASFAIQCKSCTSSASWASPASTTASYNTAVISTTCDQFPASSATFTVSIKASTVVCIDNGIPFSPPFLDRARLTLDNTHESLACSQTRYVYYFLSS